ncbi:DUF6527 family protein [Pyxidicoccus sp. 3LFB2]
MGELRRAQGGLTLFWCPGCRCAHAVNDTWHIRDGERPSISPSVLVTGDMPEEQRRAAGMPRCHLFVRDGQLEFLADCNHVLAGTTVPWSRCPARRRGSPCWPVSAVAGGKGEGGTIGG